MHAPSLPLSRLAVSSCRLLCLPALLWTVLPLAAQQGDKPGEAQDAPPARWVIPPAPTLSPAEALTTLKLPPGFRAEIVAAEPLVLDPVAMQIGPDGRIWVVEMRAFMPNVDGTGEAAPIGSVVVLSDTDGDGKMDRRTEFVSDLVLPRAMALVGDGVLIASPPHLWFYRDTDGDDIADTRTEVADDYGTVDNPEHSANGLMWGLDNWIYSANHHTRFRYLPATGQFTAAPALQRGQWGITQDDTGRLFTNTNSDPLRTDLFPGEYRLRHEELLNLGSATHDVASVQHTPLFPARITPGINRGYRMLDDEGYLREVTAACGPLVYRGTALPGSFYGNVFFCEPAANLVKRLVVQTEPDGTISGRNAYPESEFLTSTDERFRPVNLANGPDGALYVVDMYRGIIQHRMFVTTYLRQQIIKRGLDVPVGMGRIYRIVPETAPAPASEPPALDRADTLTLVQALAHRDAWWRDTAQRLLVEQADAAAGPLLRAVLLTPDHPGHLNALWALEGIGQLDIATWHLALDHADPALRIAALRAGETLMAGGEADLGPAAMKLLTDADPTVRRQAALTVSVLNTSRALPALARLAAQDDAFAATPEAILSGLSGREIDLLALLAAPDSRPIPSRTVQLASAVIVARKDPGELAGLFALLRDAPPAGAFAENLVLGVETASGGRQAKREKLKLPVEPTALRAYADRAPAGLAARARSVLARIEGPAEQAAAPASVPLTPAEQARYAQGQALYALCVGCHQPNGRGQAGLAASLVGSARVLGSEAITAAIVLKGKEGDGLAMPPLGALDDDSLAAILTYVRRSWGNDASAVTSAQVSAARTRFAARTRAWTDPELDALATP